MVGNFLVIWEMICHFHVYVWLISEPTRWRSARLYKLLMFCYLLSKKKKEKIKFISIIKFFRLTLSGEKRGCWLREVIKKWWWETRSSFYTQSSKCQFPNPTLVWTQTRSTHRRTFCAGVWKPLAAVLRYTTENRLKTLNMKKNKQHWVSLKSAVKQRQAI